MFKLWSLLDVNIFMVSIPVSLCAPCALPCADVCYVLRAHYAMSGTHTCYVLPGLVPRVWYLYWHS
eukprot:1940718-Rhodomonas_salina.2